MGEKQGKKQGKKQVSNVETVCVRGYQHTHPQ